MNRTLIILIVAGMASGLLGGCGHRYADTLHPQYADFGVRKIGVIVWCSGYVPQDPAWIDLHRIDAKKSVMKKEDKWDRTLSPLIASPILSRLRELGYEATDVSHDVPFGPKVRTADALDAIHAKYPDLDALLLVSYVVSRLNSMARLASDDPMGSVMVNTQMYSESQSNHGSYTVHRSEYRSSTTAHAAEVGGTNLRGLLKLVFLPTGEMLWEIGDHSVYGAYSAVVAPAETSRENIDQATCQRFGTAFAQPGGGRLGFPPRQPR